MGIRIVAIALLGTHELGPRSFPTQTKSWRLSDAISIALAGKILTLL